MDRQAEAHIEELKDSIITWSQHAMLWRDRYERLRAIAVDVQAALDEYEEHYDPEYAPNGEAGALYQFLSTVEQDGDPLPQEAELIEMTHRLTSAVQYLVEAVDTDIPTAVNLLRDAMPIKEGRKYA